MIPSVTGEQMREIDRLMIEALEIDLPQMMELAGLSLARLAREMLGGTVKGKRILICAGGGHNGGGGLVAARHLSNGEADAQILLTRPRDALKEVPAKRLSTLCKMEVPVTTPEKFGPEGLKRVFDGANLILDAVIGYALAGPPGGFEADVIRHMNRCGTKILSLDVPSGLDATTGRRYDPCVRARATLTLALPKTGLLKAEAQQAVGMLFLADIGVPPSLYERVGIRVGALFQKDSLVRIR